MGNILNKIEYVFHIQDHIHKCLGIHNFEKKKDTNNVSTEQLNSMEQEFNDYDIIQHNEIYPYTFSKQNK